MATHAPSRSRPRALIGAAAATVILLGVILTATLREPGTEGPAPADPADVLWRGNFEKGNFDGWALVSDQGDPERLAIVPNPVGEGKVARFTTHDSADTNPRTQLNGPVRHREGDEHFVSWRTLFPADFPDLQGWMVFFDFHGRPYEGSPPITLAADHGRLRLARDASHGFDTVWSAPLVRGRWQEFVLRVKFSRDPAVGFVELWLNGVKQRFSNGRDRVRYATLMPDQDEVLAQWANYRQSGTADVVTLFHDGPRVWGPPSGSS